MGYTLVSTVDGYETAEAFFNAEPTPIVVDHETDGKDWRRHKIAGVTLRTRGESYYFPFRHKEGTNLPLRLLYRIFTRIIHPRRIQIYHHGSFDIKVAAFHDGFVPPADGFFFDTLLAALLINENEDSFKLEDLGERYTNKNAAIQEKRLLQLLSDRFGGAKSNLKGHLHKVAPMIVAPYACQDTETTDQLFGVYRRPLERWGLYDLWIDVCNYQLDVIDMELRGVRIDLAAVEPLKKQAVDTACQLLTELREEAGFQINPNSSPQVCKWLKVKSSDQHTLARLDDPRAKKIRAYRKWYKADSTYYKPYLAHVDAEGILRCNLHITSPGAKPSNRPGMKKWLAEKRNGTVNGRLSSSDPNLQQIPREGDTYKVKHLFVARPGYVLVELDYSQMELRVAAHYSKDEKLRELLLAGVDLHTAVAEQLKIPRSIAKNVNFSAWYGIGWRKFAINYHVEPELARKYLSDYHRMFRGIKRLSRACEDRAKKNGYIRVYTGRIRHFDGVVAEYHKAANSLIQMTSAEIKRIAAMRCRREVPEALQVLDVHDALWFEVPEENAVSTVDTLTAIMQDQPKFSLPMIVDRKMSKGPGMGFANAVSMPRIRAGIPAAALVGCTDPSLQLAA